MYGHIVTQHTTKQPFKRTARQIPWNTDNTYTESPVLFADKVSLHLSHKINVTPNRKVILQCITWSVRTSAPQPVSLNLSLICLVLLWALRNNSVLSLTLWALCLNNNMSPRWSQILQYCSPLDPMQLFPLTFGLCRCTEMAHCNMNLWATCYFLLSDRHH